MDTAPRDIHALRLRHDAAWLEAELEWLWVGALLGECREHGALWRPRSSATCAFRVEPARNWTLTLRVTNLLDAAYADRADFAFGDYRYFPGRGRAYFVELGWRKD